MTELLLALIVCLLAGGLYGGWRLAEHFTVLLEAHHTENCDAGVMAKGSGRELLRQRIVWRRKQAAKGR